MKREVLLDIVQKGITAPSADNLQPWRFRIREKGIDLYLDEGRVKNFCDVDYLTPYISAGAVIENMRLAASHHGFGMTSVYFPETRNPLFAAALAFSSRTPETHPHYDAIHLRLTNRKFYKPWRKANPSLFSNLESFVSTERGFRLLWVERQRDIFRKLSFLVGEGDQMRFENQRLHREFFETIRFTKRLATQTQDGLDIRTLEAGPFASFLFRIMVSWNRVKALNLLGLSSLFRIYARMQMRSSLAAGLLVGPGQESHHCVKGGEVMERLWHEITCQGLSLQPMEAIPIFIMNLQRNGGRDFSPKQLETLERIKREFFEIFGIDDQKSLILFFRVGYANRVRVRSVRRPVESFLFEQEE